MIMFYSKLRWKIKDLEDDANELRVQLIEQGNRISGVHMQLDFANKEIRRLQQENDNLRGMLRKGCCCSDKRRKH
jgi:septal ring factor EnvC (AmiA/AmiB activator)